MFDDFFYDFVIFNKGDNAHGSLAFWTDEGIDLIDLLYHLSPSFGRYKGIFRKLIFEIFHSVYYYLIDFYEDILVIS